MDKLKKYGPLLLVVVAGVITATAIMQWYNRPKTAPPKTTTA